VNILIISPTQSGIGGIAQHVQGLTKFLKKHGHKVEIISSENTFTIPIKGLKNPSFMISSFLKAKFKKNQEIIHAHNIPAALAMKNTTGKKILSIHGIFSQQINQLHGKTTGNISEKYEKNALTWADAITVISKEAFDYYTDLGYKVFQVPNAIDISSLTLSEDRRYQKQVIFAGRLSKEKGIETLIEIAKALPEKINLLILGAGPEEQKIKDISTSQKNIHFLGKCDKDQTVSLIRGSDILIQPSLQEAISSTILEAMACKTAIIASDVGGNRELITNHKNGILLEPKNTKLFIKSINELFENSEKRQSMINESNQLIKNYDWSKVGNLYMNIYKNLLKQNTD
jgi:glycosyltransferase involved in cell wall biosynthesis